MAVLTWRNVDAPDLRGAMDGIRIASYAFDRAADRIDQGLGNFDTYRKDQAAGAVLNNTMGITDPVALQRAIADGSVFQGVNRSLLTPQALANLDARAATLLKQATGQEALDQAQKMNPLLVENQTLVNRGQGLQNDFNAAAAPLKLEGLRLGNAEQGQRISQSAELHPYKVTDARIRNEDGQLSLNERRYGFDQRQRNDADTRAAQLAVSDAIAPAVTAEDAVRNLELRTDLSPAAMAIAREALRSRWAGTYGPESAGGGVAAPSSPGSRSSGGNAAPGTRAGSPYDVTFNFQPTSQPITSTKLGDVIQFQRTQLLPSQGGSPVGAFQFTHATLSDYAPRVLGSNWQDQPFSPENQERIAKALFEDRKRGNLSETWAALPDRGPGGYANMSWEEVRPLIMRGEVGSEVAPPRSTAPVDRQAQAASTARVLGDVGGRVNQNNAPGIAGQYAEAFASTANVNDVTVELRKKGGVFENVPADVVSNNVQRIMDLAASRGMPINAAVAGQILTRYTQDIDKPNWFSRNLPLLDDRPGLTLNERGILAEVEAVTQGRRFEGQQQNQAAALIAQSLVAAQTTAEQAAQRLLAVQKRAAIVPQARENLPAAQEAYDRAVRNLEALRRQAQTPGLQPQWLPSTGEAAASQAATPTTAPVAVPSPEAIPTRPPVSRGSFWRPNG